tara:strand:- start:85 stop:771 length:687 start_codon:yes stop_codon:yes gene_type:complete
VNKLCFIVTGIVRPNAIRVVENIKETLAAVNDYNIDFYIMTYKTPEADELITLLNNESQLPVNIELIDVFKDPPGGYDGRNYMMFRTIEMMIDKIPEFDSYDCIVRHRIDCAIETITIPDQLEDNTYYTAHCRYPGQIIDYFDNIGLCKPNVFKNVFTTKFLEIFNSPNPHATLGKILQKNNYTRKPFSFKKYLYQSNDEYILGIKQWSRRDRLFHFDGNEDRWISYV